MPAAAVIRRVQALFGITGLKERVGGMVGVIVKALGSTEELLGKPPFLRQVEATGTFGGAVKCVEIERNTCGESGSLGLF